VVVLVDNMSPWDFRELICSLTTAQQQLNVCNLWATAITICLNFNRKADNSMRKSELSSTTFHNVGSPFHVFLLCWLRKGSNPVTLLQDLRKIGQLNKNRKQ